MIRPAVAMLAPGLVALTLTAAYGADLSFATPEGLFRQDVDGGDRQSLLTGDDVTINAMAWSRDGQQLAVVQNYGEVYRIAPGAAAQRVFTSDCQRPPIIELAWQSEGETLVISHRCPSAIAAAPAQVNLYLSRATEALAALSTLPDSLESDLFLAPDGSRVAYVVNQHIFVDRLDGRRPQRLTQTPGIYGAAGSPLAWSPDSTRLAFYEGNYPFQQLNVVRADGSDRRLLTPAANFQIYRSRVLWSPDGRYIAFYQPHNPPFSNQEVIALVNVNTGETQVVTRPGFYDALSWAPNSQQLALASGFQGGQQALFKLNLLNQEFTALSGQPLQNLLDTQWSPEGDWVAFTATPLDDPLGTQVLHRVRPNGTDLTALTGADEYVYPFTWVPVPSIPQPSSGE